MNILDETKRLRGMLEKATPGEWQLEDGRFGPLHKSVTNGRWGMGRSIVVDEGYTLNAILIAESRNSLPRLLDCIEEAVELAETFEKVFEKELRIEVDLGNGVKVCPGNAFTEFLQKWTEPEQGEGEGEKQDA